MADNTTLNAGTGGDVIAADDVGGIKFQRIKVTFGDDGTATDVSATNPLPITAPVALPVTGAFWQATQPVSGTVSVSGAVAVTGTFWQATQPVSIAGTVAVSGPLTDAQLRATPVPVSATFWQATQPVSAAALPLPTGAATSAKQPALGTAGSASSDVLTVQGAASMTALKVDGSAVTQPVSAASLPLPAGAATSAKQDTLLTAVQAATPAGENHIGAVGGNSVVVGGTFNRPADTTAYAVSDLVANNTTAGSVTPISAAAARVNAGTGVIRRVRLSTNKTGLAGTEQFRVHLFKTSPTVANGDNGAFSTNGVASVSLGYTDIILSHVYNDGSKGFTATDIVFDAAGGSQNIYALIQAMGVYTPASGETFTLALEVLQD